MVDLTVVQSVTPQELGAEITLKSGIHIDNGIIPVAALDNGTDGTDLATRNYVLALFRAQAPKGAVRVVNTEGGLANWTYDAGAKTLTSAVSVNMNLVEFGGVTDWAVDDRLLMRFTTSGTPRTRTGLYAVQDLGVDAVSGIVLVRTEDFNDSADIAPGSFVEVTDGDEAGSVYYLQTEGPFTLDTTQLQFAKNTSAAAPTQGDGIGVSGTTVSVRFQADKGLEFSGGGALQVKTSASGAVIADADGVRAQTDGATVNVNGSNQLYIPDGGVGNTQLGADAVDGDKLADNSVGNEHLTDDCVDSAEIADGAVDLVHLAAEVTDRMIDDLEDPAETALTDATPTILATFNIPVASGAVQKRFSAKIITSARLDATAADCFVQVGDGAFRRGSTGNAAPIDASSTVNKLAAHKAASLAACSWTLTPKSDNSGDVDVVWTGIGANHHAKARVELIELI